MKNFNDWKLNQDKELQKKIKNGIEVKCKKSLYKSTYQKNAFTKGKKYIITSKNDENCKIVDNESREFGFTFVDGNTMYKFNEYFFEN